MWLVYLHRRHRLELSRNIIQEVCSYLHPFLYVCLVKDSVSILNLESNQTTNHRLPVNFDTGVSYVMLDPYTLLCLGASTTAVFALSLTSFQFTSLPPLQVSKFRPGLIKIARCVYVFGGGAPDNKSCEKYCIAPSRWQGLSSMHFPRYGFTPCATGQVIYLAGALPASSQAVETFNCETEEFTVLSVSLPAQLRYSSVAFIANGDLCLLTAHKQFASWKIGVDKEFRLSLSDRECWSTQPPLATDSLVFIASVPSRKVEKWDPKTHSFL